MTKPRGKEHTTLTETADTVVRELEKISGIKMIAPGEIRTNRRGAGGRFLTITYTKAGFELLISGQSSQKVAVHTIDKKAKATLCELLTELLPNLSTPCQSLLTGGNRDGHK